MFDSATKVPTIGMDLGDKHSQLWVLDASGEFVEETRISTTKASVKRLFSARPPTRVALEVGTHSGWVCRLLEELGHEVLVANPRKLRAIFENDSKTDKSDARFLAEVAFFRPSLLRPIRHRGVEAQQALGLIRARDALVRSRTTLVNHVRGVVKASGERMPKCSSASFHKKRDLLPEGLQSVLGPMLDVVEALTDKIHGYDNQIEEVAAKQLPETRLLNQVHGVGTLTAVAYVATVEDPNRFPKGRRVGSYLGLRPRLDQSGSIDRQLRITKAGDTYLRRLLVGSAHRILGQFGIDSDLRRWGLALCARGGKNAKKRAVVAVARKLAVLLHTLWKTGATYDPLFQAKRGLGSDSTTDTPLQAA